MTALLLGLLFWSKSTEDALEPSSPGLIQAPVLSVESGFYDAPFALEISASEKAKVYYTLDGSIPDEDSFLYTQPLQIVSGGGRESGATFVRNMKVDWLNGDGESHPNCATVAAPVPYTKTGG